MPNIYLFRATPKKGARRKRRAVFLPFGILATAVVLAVKVIFFTVF